MALVELIGIKTKNNMDGIHFLKGTGSNCTCNDCAVLYGGTCYTTPTNNFLDKLEQDVQKWLSFTPTGRPKKVSDNYTDQCIERVVRPAFMKYKKISRSQFYEKYYSFLPLIFLMNSDKKDAKHMYRKARIMLFWDIEKWYENK